MTLIIAEAGVNHNGDEALALKLIDEAHRAGADIVKFQTFKSDKLVNASATQAEYQVRNTQKQESQLDMLRRLELSYASHEKLLAHANALGIEFLSTAFDSESLHFLVNELGLKRLKVPSGELTNTPLLLEHAQTDCELILSTGMASLGEVEEALAVIAFGSICGKDTPPSREAFLKAYFSEAGQQALKNRLTLLHCTTEYPTPVEDVNLKAMDTLASSFGLPVGYSDHTAGIHVPIAAVARGAVLIEKHFTLDKQLPGPDHKASLEPGELRDMIKGIRDIEIALGGGIKAPKPSEIKNKAIARKSLVASATIKQGDLFTTDNLTVMRPGSGIEPKYFWQYLGKAAVKSYSLGQLIDE